MEKHRDERPFSLDEIGVWSETKLEIIRKYAGAFSVILAKQPRMHFSYIDGFAGAGLHRRKGTGEEVAGSPLNVALINPRFHEYHLVELDERKVGHLNRLFEADPDVSVHHGDCNDLLVRMLLPRIQYGDYKRAFCLLDPYGLHLDWAVVHLAGQLRTIDLLINFPTADMNRNVLWNRPESVDPSDAVRMTRFWGDETWREASYGEEATLFGPEARKRTNDDVVQAYCDRLKSVAGFPYVAKPLPMRNSMNATVYYLVFASQKQVAVKIMDDIVKRHRDD